MFHIHDEFAIAIGKNFDILAEREKKLFDEMETENPSFDSESSKTVAKEETEESLGASKEDLVPARVSPEHLFSKNGSVCRDTPFP